MCLFASPTGAIQSFAGFTDYFTAMAQEGWFPLLCVGLRPYWENHHLQDLQDSYGQEWVSPCPTPSHGALISSATYLVGGPRSVLHVTELSQSIPDTQTLCQFWALSYHRLELQTPAADSHRGHRCRGPLPALQWHFISGVEPGPYSVIVPATSTEYLHVWLA